MCIDVAASCPRLPACWTAGSTSSRPLSSSLAPLGAQVRVGNGKNWSQWSQTSKAFLYQVPPPVPPTAASLKAQRTVNVEVMSATAARVVWGDFKPAPGLTMLEYEVRATPEQGTGSSKVLHSPVQVASNRKNMNKQSIMI